jgi:hypothetical protein
MSTPKPKAQPVVSTPVASPLAIEATLVDPPIPVLPEVIEAELTERLARLLSEGTDEERHDALYNDNDRHKFAALAPTFIRPDEDKALKLYASMYGVAPSAYQDAFLHGVFWALRRYRSELVGESESSS